MKHWRVGDRSSSATASAVGLMWSTRAAAGYFHGMTGPPSPRSSRDCLADGDKLAEMGRSASERAWTFDVAVNETALMGAVDRVTQGA